MTKYKSTKPIKAPFPGKHRKILTWGAILFVVLLSAACNRPEPSPYPPLQWSKKAGFPDGARSSSTACTVDGKAYLLFGRKAKSSQYQQDCWEYDAGTDTWTKKAPCPGMGRVKAVGVAMDGKIYTGLGYTNKEYIDAERLYNDTMYLKDFWCYDPQADTWTEETRAPFKGTDACVAFTHENEVYVGLGFHGLSFGNEWWKYNPADRQWRQLKYFTGPDRAGALLCSNGKRIFTGTGYRTYNLNDWWEYLPESDTWKERRKMPDNGRVNGAALTVQGRIFVTTGRQFNGSETGGHVKSTVFEYAPDRDTWYDAGHIPGPGRENAVTFTIGDKGYVGLGENDEKLLGDIMCFEAGSKM